MKAHELVLEGPARFQTSGIERATRQLARLSLLLLAVVLVLTVFSSYLDIALGLSFTGGSLTIEEARLLAVAIVGGALLLAVGASGIRAGGQIVSGESASRSAFIALTSFSVFLILLGVDFFFLLTGGTQLSLPLILAITLPALLIAGGSLYLADRTATQVAGGVLGVAAVGTLLVGGLRIQLVSPLLADVVVMAGYALVGVAAILLPVLRNTRANGGLGIAAALGILVFGGWIVITSFASFAELGAVLGSGISLTLFAVPPLIVALGAFLITVSGGLIVVTSGLAIAFFARGITRPVPLEAPAVTVPETLASPPRPAEPGIGTAVVGPLPAGPASAKGAGATEEDWMGRLMELIGDLERKIQEQQEFLFRLDKALMEGRVEKATYHGIKEPRLERIVEMQDKVTKMRTRLLKDDSREP